MRDRLRSFPVREKRWRGLAEAMRALVFVAEPDGRNTYTNHRFQRYVGMPAAALLDTGWLTVVHPEDRARASETWGHSVATGEAYEAEYRFRRHDGHWRWNLCAGEPERDEAGHIVRWIGYAFEIEDRKAAEARQRELAALLEATTDNVLAVDRDWRVTFMNRRAMDQISNGRDLRGEIIWQMFKEAMGGPFWEAYQRTMHERVPAVADAYYPPLGRHFRAESHPREDGGLVIFFRDVTEERTATERLAESEADLNDFFENAVMPLHWVGPDGTILRANRAELDLLGYSAEEYIGRHIAEFHADGPAIDDILRRLLDGEELHDHPARLRRKDGAIRDVLITSNARHGDGIFLHSRCFTRDITEQKRAEAALLEEKRTLEVLSRTGTAVAAELDLDRVVQLVTDVGTELTDAAFGAFFYNVTDERGESYTLYALSGAPREAFSRFPMPRNTAIFAPTFNGEGIVRSDDITRDARYGKSAPYNGMPEGHLPVRSYLAVPVVSRSGEVLGGLFFGHGSPGVFTEHAEHIVAGIAGQAAIAIDNARLYQAAQREIAARKSAEESLRESEWRFRAMADNIPQFAWMARPDGHIFWYNRRWFEYTGTTLEQMQGWGWTQVHHPDYADKVVERIHRSWDTGEPWEDTFPLRGKDGQHRWFLSRALPIRDAEGRVTLWFGTNTDITEQRRADEVRQILAREVDHRAKNALAVVQSLLRLTPARGEEARRFATAVADRVSAMARAHQLLSADRWAGAELKALVQEEMAAYQIGGSSRVQISGPSVRLPPDAAQPISMLLHELATNAAKYGALSAPGGQVQVTWEYDAKADGDFRLDWRETGGPPVTSPPSDTPRGFGSKLIEMTVVQLSGRVEFDWKPTGLCCTLRIPASQLAPTSDPLSSGSD